MKTALLTWPIGSRSRKRTGSRWTNTAAMLTARPVFAPPDEAESLPVAVDRTALVVDQAGRQADPLDGVEVEVGLELRRLLRPRDPEPVGGVERVAERREPPLQVGPVGREQDDHADAGLRAELGRERRRGVVLAGHGADANARCSPRGRGEDAARDPR